MVFRTSCLALCLNLVRPLLFVGCHKKIRENETDDHVWFEKINAKKINKKKNETVSRLRKKKTEDCLQYALLFIFIFNWNGLATQYRAWCSVSKFQSLVVMVFLKIFVIKLIPNFHWFDEKILFFSISEGPIWDMNKYIGGLYKKNVDNLSPKLASWNTIVQLFQRTCKMLPIWHFNKNKKWGRWILSSTHQNCK